MVMLQMMHVDQISWVNDCDRWLHLTIYLCLPTREEVTVHIADTGIKWVSE